MSTNRDIYKLKSQEAKSKMFEKIPVFKKASGSMSFPHQGTQECARRVRQMKSGFIKI